MKARGVFCKSAIPWKLAKSAQEKNKERAETGVGPTGTGGGGFLAMGLGPAGGEAKAGRQDAGSWRGKQGRIDEAVNEGARPLKEQRQQQLQGGGGRRRGWIPVRRGGDLEAWSMRVGRGARLTRAGTGEAGA